MTQIDAQAILSKLTVAARELAGQSPWQDVTLSDMCATAELTLSDCARARITKADIAAQLDADLDQAMLSAQPKVDRSQGVRDRLFDILMGRFDAMEEDRATWVSVINAQAVDPMSKLARRARRVRSCAWALEAAGVTASDFAGAGRAIGLARVLRQVQGVWLDDGADLAKTMARLDQSLRKAEEQINRLSDLQNMVSSFGLGRRKAPQTDDAAMESATD